MPFRIGKIFTLWLITCKAAISDITWGKFANFQRNKQVFFIKKVFIIACILVGLEYLHENHIVHNNIKLKSFKLVNDCESIKLADFSKAYQI